MWVVLFIAAPIAIASLFMEETLKSRILQQREKKVGIQVPRQTIDFPLLIGKLTKAFIIPLHMMFVEVCLSLMKPSTLTQSITASRSSSQHLHRLRFRDGVQLL
jgi:hypothetical protein